MHSYLNSQPPVPVMQGSPPPPDMRVTLANWDRPPFNRWSFQHMREILPTVAVRRGGGQARALPVAEEALDGLEIDLVDGRRVTLAALLDETFTDGILVIHRGRIVYERYFNGMAPETLHLSQSVSKSVCAAVAGILLGRGLLDPDAPVADYVPEFAHCGYGGARLRHVLDMRSGVKFSEDYLDPHCDMGLLDVASGWKPIRSAAEPTNVFDVILGLHQVREHGGPFEYRSIETDVMAFCLERVTGKRLAELVSDEIWSAMGAACDAEFTVDAAGYALACGGLSASLRDFGRFGQMLLDGGTVDDRQVVPADWVAQCSMGDREAFAGPYKEIYPNGAYRNQFWIADADRSAFMARGVFGQLIHIDPEHETVTVKLSTWPDFLNPVLAANTANAVAAITRALCEDQPR